MKQIEIFFVLLSAVVFGSGCAVKTRYRTAASIASEAYTTYQDTTMVNVISANRVPASLGSIELSPPTAEVSVSTQLIRAPGEKNQHAVIVFTVKNNPAVAGQIMGNTGGSEISARFTEVVKKIHSNGISSKAQTIIESAQVKFKKIVSLGSEQRADAIKIALLETREQLLAAY